MLKAAETLLVIFDCDGVLVDSEILSAKTLLELLEPQGVSIDFSHIQEHFLGRSFPTVSTSIREQFSVDLPDDFEQEYRRVLLERFETQLRPTKDIFDVLTCLGVASVVATSSSPERVERSLQITGLDQHFSDHVFTASEVEKGKPAPDLFLHVARQRGVDPATCLVIEDSGPGVEAAVAAGMDVLRFVGGSHFEGLRDTIKQEEKRAAVFDSWSKFFDMMPMLKRTDI